MRGKDAHLLLVGSNTERAAWIMSVLAEPTLEITWDPRARPGAFEHQRSYDMVLVDAGDPEAAKTLPAWINLEVPVIVLVRDSDAAYPFFPFGVSDVLAVPCGHPMDFRARVRACLSEEAERASLKSRLVQMEAMLRESGAGQTIDSVTGVMAKNRIVEALSYEYSRVERYGVILTIMFVRIDGFFEIQKEGGFLTADAVAADAAKSAKAVMRSTDLIGRYNEDMFLVLCPHTKASEALVPAKRMLGEWGREIRPPLSIGIAGAPSYGIRSVEGLWEAARQALSDAARMGGAAVYGRSVLGEIAV